MSETNESVAPRGVADPDGFEPIPEFLMRLPVLAEGAPSIAAEVLEPTDQRPASSNGTDDNEEAISGVFHRGETPASSSDSLIISADPAREAALIAEDLNRGKEATLRACARLWHAFEMLDDDIEAKNLLVDALIDLSVVGKKDQRHGLDKSTISKMRKVGKWAAILGLPGVLDRISAGYSVLYAAALLLEEMKGATEKRAVEMAELFRGVRGGITRDFLERELKRRKSKPVPEQNSDRDYDFGDQIDVLVMTPSEADWSRIRSDHATADMLSRCLRLDLMGPVEAVMIVSPIREMPAAIKLLGCCGFEQMSHVLLAESPRFADVIDATVVVTAERNQGHVVVVPPDWAESYSDTVNARQIVDELAPNAKVKVHVFAAVETDDGDGWTTISGRDAWAEELSIR